PSENNSFVFVHSGSGSINDSAVNDKDLMLIEAQDSLKITATKAMHVIIVSGKPIGEAIYQHGPFVMNTHEEIEKAFYDYQQGTLVQAS
ncbi:MAG: pirin-like C-terminal cupin domain-containing protein, partial [Leucothrix sp.]